MTPIASPLEIIDFAITGFDFELSPNPVESRVSDYFKQYTLDIDFEISKNDVLHVAISAAINDVDNPLPGYKISAEAGVIFEPVKDDRFSETDRNSMEGFSTIYIALNTLRGFISNFTANAPFGRYILPSIDLNDLIEKKRALLSEADANQGHDEVEKENTKQRKMKK